MKVKEREFRPGVYRLFKDNKPLKERMYNAYGIVYPWSYDMEQPKEKTIAIYEAQHTEAKGITYAVKLLENGKYISLLLPEPHVLYQSLCDDKKLYIRPLDMFMSLTDHEKYPQFKQRYRFEFLEDDYRFKPVKWDIKTNNFIEKDIGYLYIGELQIEIQARDSETLWLRFNIGNEESGYGVTSTGVFYDFGGSTEIKINQIIKIDDFKKIVLDHVYDYIESYKDDTLRIKANSKKETNW